MAQIELKGVRKSFGPATVIHGVDLQIADGEFCVFVGPSGCGKSTLLRLIAGLEECSEGTISIGGVDVTDAQPARRGIAMVFQSYALYPHMTVAQNMGFGLRMIGVPQARIDEAVTRAAQTLRIEHLLGRRPKDLSGGQRQRVAIGRAIVRDPKLFLFDEPLSNLDAALRVEMRVELSKIKAQLGTTFVYVTHDQIEAMTLADKIVVLRDGRIEQVGSPLQLYTRPANRFVAGFIGSPKMNFLDVGAKGGRGAAVQVALPGGGTLSLSGDIRLPADPSITLGVRPEHLQLADLDNSHLRGRVVLAERLGGETYVHAQVESAMVLVKAAGDAPVRAGENVGLSIAAREAHLFNSAGARIAVAEPHALRA
ncbi:sn-glycerol-3-phosphate ABC transporter ATP-binding protein UgpC [Paraburkholderia sp. C35]|uniref:ABC transporter ATP-binding protein n=1 Tax=Paraburkholderia sp. C35 TaxID=2126993 RepID=UPI000D690BB7|nr:sn-glycerol-3-phosphate ABC transporter ATP-binding protein UgpC [Paraburkholderia sp. C35]